MYKEGMKVVQRWAGTCSCKYPHLVLVFEVTYGSLGKNMPWCQVITTPECPAARSYNIPLDHLHKYASLQPISEDKWNMIRSISDEVHVTTF